jgi:hypothetical protein
VKSVINEMCNSYRRARAHVALAILAATGLSGMLMPHAVHAQVLGQGVAACTIVESIVYDPPVTRIVELPL